MSELGEIDMSEREWQELQQIRMREERDALHRALDNLMALVHRDYRDYNAWDAGIRALIPGHRDGLGVTVAFADEVERALDEVGRGEGKP